MVRSPRTGGTSVGGGAKFAYLHCAINKTRVYLIEQTTKNG
jgi:hypothetical protein